MKPILIDLDHLEPGASPQLITSANQEHATDLPAAVTSQGDVVSRWRLTDDERRWVLAGADVYVFMRTHGRPVQPISLVVGPERRPFDERPDTGEHLAPNGNPIDGYPRQQA